MAGAHYGVHGVRTGSETTLGTLFGETDATTPTRVWIYDMVLGTNNTPADAAIEFAVTFATAGTPAGAAVVPAALEQDNDAPATSDWLETLTTNPITIAAEPVLRVGLNQRATFRWVAAPGSEIVIAGTVGNGALWQQLVDSAGANKVVSAMFIE